MKKYLIHLILLSITILVVIGITQRIKINQYHKIPVQNEISTNNNIFDEAIEKPDIESENKDVSQDTTNKILATTPETKTATNEETIIPTKKVFTCDKPSHKNTSNYDWLYPVSVNYSIETYIPPDLTIIPDTISTNKKICLREKVIPELSRMVESLKTEGLNITIVSGYRSYQYQKNLHENNNPIIIDGVSYDSIAKPQHSEHQLGTTIDIVSSPDYTIAGFEKTPAYTWMTTHAKEYGFVQSYHYGQEPLTGYRGEPWHWRYVGADNALAINDQGITLGEYLFEKIKDSLKDIGITAQPK